MPVNICLLTIYVLITQTVLDRSITHAFSKPDIYPYKRKKLNLNFYKLFYMPVYLYGYILIGSPFHSEAMKARASRNAREAFRAERARTQLFDSNAGASDANDTDGGADVTDGHERRHGDHEQPNIFRGTLKGYQLKGMNWLANLYDQVSFYAMKMNLELECRPFF